MDTILPALIEFAGAITVGWIAFTQPRFQYRRIGFVYKLRDGLVALGLAVVLTILCILVANGIFPDPFADARLVPGLTRELSAAALGLLVTAGLLALRRQPLKSAGWGKATQRGGLMVGLSLAFLVVFLSGRFVSMLQGAAALPQFLPGLAVICLAEETIFRGYIQLRLEWWLGRTNGLLLSAVLFFLWRLPLLLLRPEMLLLRLGLVFVQALVLGWLMRSSGHVLAPLLYRFISLAVDSLLLYS